MGHEWTEDELDRDSLNGIVPTSDPTPKYQYIIFPEGVKFVSTSGDDEGDEDEESTAGDEGKRSVHEDFHRAKGLAKIKYVNEAVIFNHLIRASLKKGHEWIFVICWSVASRCAACNSLKLIILIIENSDTSFRLYIGYK